MSIRVIVSGSGTMGQHVMHALQEADDIEIVAVIEKFSSGPIYELQSGQSVPLRQGLGDLASFEADVLVDFSNVEWTMEIVPIAIDAGIRPVIGTSGLTSEFLVSCAEQCATARLGGLIASNFALGAVLMMHLAQIAAPYFDSAEVIEQHHDGKVDAPSGTAITTAKEMRAAREQDFERNYPENETLPGSRGASLSGISLHSVRLPGLVAHQSVLFGRLGETLTIRHDSMSRESFMPGVLHAVRGVMEKDRLIIGLDRLLGLRE